MERNSKRNFSDISEKREETKGSSKKRSYQEFLFDEDLIADLMMSPLRPPSKPRKSALKCMQNEDE